MCGARGRAEGETAGGVHYAQGGRENAQVVTCTSQLCVLPLPCMHAVPGATPLEQLMSDAMTLAAAKGYDVFNALDLLEVR